MAYETKVKYATDSHFTNPTTITENGQPSSVSLQGLTPNTGYYTKAEIWENGGLQDTSDTEMFSTIPAGVITLSHYQTVRSGYAYDVTYTYTSTYAPSFATLSTNGMTFQGVFDSAQHSVSFLVTGLTAGNAYLTNVTLGDIYGESETVMGSITTTVVNYVSITDVETAFTTADVDLEYIVDGGFYTGRVEWWYGTQDPTQDQPLGHVTFIDGAESVSVTGLTSGTEYKFRASITLSDQTTTINSSVVAAETEVPYSQRYFTIENIESESNTIGLLAGSNAAVITVEVSTDNGTTWSQVTSTTSGATLATLGVGEKLIMKHIDGFGYDSSTGNKITATGSFDAYGNIASLTHGDNFNTTGLVMPNYAFLRLFNGTGNKLVHTENLYFGSYSTAGDYCLDHMYSECTAIKTSPDLSTITTLDNYCFCRTFYGCSALERLSTLPATAMAEGAYYGMYQGCSSIETPPSLPATTLANSCYTYILRDCTSLTTTPSLPATTLTSNCYYGAFWGCTGLTSSAALPATTLPQNAYRQMYQGCSRLAVAPKLNHVTSIGANALDYMFDGCSLINYIYAPSVGTWNSENSTDWLANVAATGTMYKTSYLSMPTNSSSGIPTGWTAETDVNSEYFTIVNEYAGNNTIRIGFSWSGTNSPTGNATLSYSKNGSTWSNVTASPIGTWTHIDTLAEGERLYIKHTGAMGYGAYGMSTWYTYNTFSSTQEFSVRGNIASLTHGEDFRQEGLTLPGGFADVGQGCFTFFHLFDSSKIIDASNLVLTPYTKAPGCGGMFYNCSSLQRAPELPIKALTSYCYHQMFYYATALETPPDLPATASNISCYGSMFEHSGITTPPSIKLRNAQKNAMNSMFKACTSLTEGSDIRACERNNYENSMFNMYFGCTSLNKAYAPNISTWNTDYTKEWLRSVAASGTLYKPANLSIPTSNTSGVPSGWSTEDY